MDQVSQINLPASRIAFIKAGWHGEIVTQCYDACRARFTENPDVAVEVTAFDVPGALEIPLMAQDLIETGQYDAVIASALIVDGGIYRHDFVSTAVIDGMMRVQLDTGVPIFSAVLTPHHFQESDAHQNFFHDHFKIKGREVADACLAMLQVRRTVVRAA
ncbi:6,7-dimethyl-8-ribityllumazine synthase [Paremcibacter congregatus]|uniref:6,7-dimethyl-8-ribityllumazine synthase n=1 Tax=Paremcibacter congregatus TaxID=2043170 RepID=UPI003A92C6D6|tara:strand:+ start:754 stop:1233 length:480 start_codon:yes stop_codon:yes gene_type:complete